MNDSESTSTHEPPPEPQPLSQGGALEGEVVRPRERPGESQEPGIAGEVQAESGEAAGEPESIERGLAQFAFIREERYREVRLLFRDASPSEIARTFRSAGAHLITLSAERAWKGSGANAPPAPDAESEGDEAPPEAHIEEVPKHRPTQQRSSRVERPTGEVLLRYFYALGVTVYTVTMVSPTGMTESIAPIYPLASRSEQELSERLAVVFTRD